MSKDIGHNRWVVNRQVNLSVFIQLLLLASLIVGTWVNLQNRLAVLQHDVDMMIDSNKCFQKKLDSLAEHMVACEYRIRAMEKEI